MLSAYCTSDAACSTINIDLCLPLDLFDHFANAAVVSGLDGVFHSRYDSQYRSRELRIAQNVTEARSACAESGSLQTYT